MPHECKQEDKIRKLEIDLAVAKSDIATVKSEISGINTKLNQFVWWFICMLVTTIGGMAAILLKLKGVG
jgi:hypothetical protein